jgi:hypothetical protein
MISCLLVDNDKFNTIKVKNLTEDNIYKKCNYKTNIDFNKIMSLEYNNNFLEVWGKTKGKMELNKNIFLKNNKLECYGKFIIILKDVTNKYLSLDSNEFFKYFNILNNNENTENTENTIKTNTNENKTDLLINEEKLKKLENNDDSNSEVSESNDSELSYELYCYTSDEE